MPSCFDVWMIEGIWNVLPSRMRFEIAGVVSRISRAATRPPPSFLHSVCAITPLSDSDNITRICDCRSAGNWSIMRSTVDAAVVVCSVPNTRWPVSAVSMAMARSEEHTSELQSRFDLVCRLLLEKKINDAYVDVFPPDPTGAVLTDIPLTQPPGVAFGGLSLCFAVSHRAHIVPPSADGLPVISNV